jgi:tripartite-type tricarboxylate transporter receptor subunit TctC
MKPLKLLLPLAFAVAFAGNLVAAEFPDRQMRMIVPFPPGALTDLVARTTAEYIKEKTGQTVIVENRPGAAGNTGTKELAEAAPDGYTIGVIANSIMGINPHIYKSMPFDPLLDIAPVAGLVEAPALLVANVSAPFDDLAGLLMLAKEKPGQVTYGSSGFGSPLHLNMHLIGHLAGVELLHVPYPGAAPAMVDLLGGRIDVITIGYGVASEHVKAGKLKLIAAATRDRLDYLPDVPTVSETIGKDFHTPAWFALAAPRGTPAEIVEKLNSIVNQMLDDPDVTKRFKVAYLSEMRTSPAELRTRIENESDSWKALAEETKLEKQ